MMIGLAIYIGWGARRREVRGAHGCCYHWHKWGPTYLTVVAGFLIMADLTRHILEDVGAWPERLGYNDAWGSGEYRADCPEETMHCLSPMGVLFTIVFTYLGFALLVVGTMWNANIVDKLSEIRQEWRRLRGMM